MRGGHRSLQPARIPRPARVVFRAEMRRRRLHGDLLAAFTQDETDIIVRETHRMGKKAISHSVGREATLYAARAGVDLIFHGFDLDAECIAAMLESGSALCPTLTHPR